MPAVSVIIPVYNRASFVAEAVDSVLSQTFTDFECIVVDDGSTDATPAVLASYGGRIRVISRKNSGVSAARNVGIVAARGRWIAFLDSDDYWLPEKLACQMTFLKENPALRIAQCQERWIRRGRVVNPRKKHRKKGGRIFYDSLALCLISPSAVIIEKSLLEDVGFFDETLPVCEDYDLWLRITRTTAVGLLDEELMVRRGGHDDQLSASRWGMDRFRVQALEKILSACTDPAQRRAVLAMLVKKLRVLKLGRAKRPELPDVFSTPLQKYEDLLRGKE
ncbi:MAG: glycosyltransferase family 2 protein [Fibrobacterota bacterium]